MVRHRLPPLLLFVLVVSALSCTGSEESGPQSLEEAASLVFPAEYKDCGSLKISGFCLVDPRYPEPGFDVPTPEEQKVIDCFTQAADACIPARTTVLGGKTDLGHEPVWLKAVVPDDQGCHLAEVFDHGTEYGGEHRFEFRECSDLTFGCDGTGLTNRTETGETEDCPLEPLSDYLP